jgi:hypothetical protein
MSRVAQVFHANYAPELYAAELNSGNIYRLALPLRLGF